MKETIVNSCLKGLVCFNLELKVAFAAFDEGSKGVIASSDLGAALRRLGIVFMPPDLSAMLEKAGKSGKNKSPPEHN